MELEGYLKKKGLKKSWFAQRVGISRRTLLKIFNGYKVSALMAMSIEAHTNGEIRAESVCKDANGLKFLKEDV